MGLILNFHGIGRPPRALEEGEAPYWLGEDQFSAILDLIGRRPDACAITFDDGNSSDFHIAAPMLKVKGLTAKFFVLAGRLGELGYLTQNEVFELDQEPLFTIGSHGMMHRDWTECDDEELHFEIGAAQSILTDICKRRIDEVALPFGRYDRRVIERLKCFGHRLIYSSDGAWSASAATPIARLSLRSDLSMQEIESLILRGPSLLATARTYLRTRAKSHAISARGFFR